MEKNPEDARTRPAPAQVAHVLGSDPGLAPVPEQVSQLMAVGTEMSAV